MDCKGCGRDFQYNDKPPNNGFCENCQFVINRYNTATREKTMGILTCTNCGWQAREDSELHASGLCWHCHEHVEQTSSDDNWLNTGHSKSYWIAKTASRLFVQYVNPSVKMNLDDVAAIRSIEAAKMLASKMEKALCS